SPELWKSVPNEITNEEYESRRSQGIHFYELDFGGDRIKVSDREWVRHSARRAQKTKQLEGGRDWGDVEDDEEWEVTVE
nr:putative VPg protein [Imperata yellow mottle virus]YP_007688707.1 putative VPg protein [Imperata yellow mottle virus]